MMPDVRVYLYNDVKPFKNPTSKVHSNLCTWYYENKKRFCGNYCSRGVKHGFEFHRRCWRHKRNLYSSTIPPIVLLMISSSPRIYNRDRWIKFLVKCQRHAVPVELVIYHENMLKGTVRDPMNLVSRFRPFPNNFGKVLPLDNQHGGIHYTQIYLQMLEYGCKIPNTARCIVITERTVPLRSPKTVYNRAMALKCHVDISYNVMYGPRPEGLPSVPRPFEAVNNLAQGLFTTDFLREALPTVPLHCKKFGITLVNGVYTVTDQHLLKTWINYTGGLLDEFWLLNSFLMSQTDRPIRRLTTHMEKTVERDKYTVAHMPVEINGLKRAYVFKSYKSPQNIRLLDRRATAYYSGLGKRVSLKRVIKFLRRTKPRALLFRSVELP